MLDAHRFFATPGPMTDPGRHRPLLDPLPADIPMLVRIVHGLMIHIFWAGQYGVELDEQRRREVQLRAVEKQLGRIIELDSRPLSEARDADRKLVGNCRDFSVLLTTILRHKGLPARARCGFGRYFLPDHYEDHWVAEYWNAAENRWILVDAQLDELQRGKLGIMFDPLDVPRDQFVTGGMAWAMCRAGEADPEKFGIHDMHGMWFIRGDLGRDVAALNKVELLPWDSWGIVDRAETSLTTDDMASLDQTAALSGGDVPDFHPLRLKYESDGRWRVPPVIRSYTEAGPQTVDLSRELAKSAI